MGLRGKGSRRNGPSNAELELARDMGAATYLAAHIWLMADQLGVTEDLNNENVNAMAELMVTPLNLATEATFRELMNDRTGAQDAMQRLRMALETMPKP